MNLLLLVDGEHHPPAVRDAIEAIEQGGRRVVGAVFCGGREKVDVDELDDAYGVPTTVPDGDLRRALADAIDRHRPDAVLDCTDEPVLTSADRFRLASVALARGVRFGGADFELSPPAFADVLSKPSISVFATGKRTGKTAVASALARHAAERGHRPVIVAVGRGGPNPPRVIEAGTTLDADVLLELAAGGQHASSDYVEDALTSGVTTIGCVRVGGGLAGATVISNVSAGAAIAQQRDEDLVILEGSGASIPEVRATARLIVVPATLPPEEIGAYLNPYRLLLADLAVVTMAEEPRAADAAAAAIREARGSVPELGVLPVVFRPQPMADVAGRRAFFVTTAPTTAGATWRDHLEREHGCDVVGGSHHLSDRRALRDDLTEAPEHDVLLVELKAAAVDVAVRTSRERGVDVVFLNNGLVGTHVEDSFDRLIWLTHQRSRG